MFEIIPGILEQKPEKAIEKLETVKSFAKTVQIDILDGFFAPNKTFLEFSFLKRYSSTLLLEAHIMTDKPAEYIEQLAKAGFKRFIGQIEKMKNQAEFLRMAKKYGEAGLALDLDTEVEEINTFDHLDSILLMSVRAGFSGQDFNPKVLEKIKKIKMIKKEILIELDGGVNERTIKMIRDAGADCAVATSAIFNGNPSENYQKLQLAVNQT